MKKYLKRLRQEIIIKSMNDILGDNDLFEAWDQNHIEFEGDCNEFHNVASVIAKMGYYDRACYLLEEGIKQYPNDCDLLADYLSFGIKCDKLEQCEEYYGLLNKISDKKKTWRSFTFAIDFLINKMNMSNDEKEMEDLKEVALGLVERFKKNLPREELAYLSEYRVYEAALDKDSGLQKLESFLNAEDRIAKVAPKCHLRYIDEMLERGEYDEVVVYACDGAAEAAQEQEGVDTGFFFYALALAKDALWLKADSSNRNDDEAEADLILKYYQTAYDTLDDEKTEYFSVIKKRFKIISNISGLDKQLKDWRKEESLPNARDYFKEI